ncbi:hypothetical protein A8C56_13115 [Niabella ginsenosidivorans]|uniref:Uncharacterized protein n=1 Tax=Niabella ginsenosidivorans TaxID=1176587 RepID=A0A1A9I2F1_9BACT|nr:hypothetical protein A8C56_13115 [Niabella ginsenosidivorans]
MYKSASGGLAVDDSGQVRLMAQAKSSFQQNYPRWAGAYAPYYITGSDILMHKQPAYWQSVESP